MSDEEVIKVTSASGAASVVVTEPVVTPKVPKKGVYTLEAGDTPGRVSIKLYGRSHRAVELARLNPDCMWEPGDVIDLP
jgi:hypothetical protein